MKADLHFHSIYSDGELDTLEIVNVLKEKNVTFACLTDHDSIKGCESFIKHAKSENIRCYPALELTTKRNEESIHITAYFKSLDSISKEFTLYLDSMKEKRYQRLKKMTDNLNNLYNLDIDFNEIAKLHPNNLERPHLAEQLELKLGITKKEAFERYIGNNCPAYIPASDLSIEDGIELIHRANGLAFLAHPYLYKKNNSYELIDLYNFDGVEVFYYPTSSKKYKKYLKVVKKKGLLASGGSDFHRFNDFVHKELGSGEISPPYIGNLIEAIEKLK